MILVLNEWIFHDVLGENGIEVQREAALFLDAFHSSSDQLVLPSEPRWIRKAYQLMTQTSPMLVQISKQFQSLLQDSERTIDSRNLDEVGIPQELLDQVPGEDVYLVLAYLSAGADLLITTDQGLFDSVANSELVSCQTRGEFLSSYLS